MRPFGTATDPRTPQNLTRIGLGRAPRGFLDGPEDDQRPLVVTRLEQREGAHLDIPQLVVGGQANVETALCGAPFAQRGRQREVVRGERATLVVEGTERPRPFLPGQPTDLLECAAQQLRG